MIIAPVKFRRRLRGWTITGMVGGGTQVRCRKLQRRQAWRARRGKARGGTVRIGEFGLGGLRCARDAVKLARGGRSCWGATRQPSKAKYLQLELSGRIGIGNPGFYLSSRAAGRNVGRLTPVVRSHMARQGPMKELGHFLKRCRRSHPPLPSWIHAALLRSSRLALLTLLYPSIWPTRADCP